MWHCPMRGKGVFDRCQSVSQSVSLSVCLSVSGKWVVSLELSSIKPFVFDTVLGRVAFPVDSILCHVQGGVNGVCKDDRTCDCSVVWFCSTVVSIHV